MLLIKSSKLVSTFYFIFSIVYAIILLTKQYGGLNERTSTVVEQFTFIIVKL